MRSETYKGKRRKGEEDEEFLNHCKNDLKMNAYPVGFCSEIALRTQSEVLEEEGEVQEGVH